jgi:Ankyrin repeat
MPLLSQPLLPVDFVRQVEANPIMAKIRSDVYTQKAHDNRLQMRNWNKPLSPDFVVLSDDFSRPGFTRKAGRTSVHMACFDGDILLLCEYLRCGATADKVDSAGISPLYLALSQMASFKFMQLHIIQNRTTQHRPRHGNGTLWQEVDFEHGIAQCAWLARILVEQHADVNREVDGISILHLACKAANWETISLLLEHGAAVKAPLTPYFASLKDRQRLSALTLVNSRPRPPRTCPCWSGRTISDCHGKEPQPYPLHFICVCGSGKTYDRCCSQKTPVKEEWNKKSQRIIHGFDLASDKKLPEMIPEFVRQLQTEAGPLAELRALLGIKEDKHMTSLSAQQTSHEISKLMAMLLAKGLIDPAFAYAASHCGFVPR